MPHTHKENMGETLRKELLESVGRVSKLSRNLSAARVLYFLRLWAGSKLSTRLLPSRVSPIIASLKLTENCNSRCVTCDYWKSHCQDRISTEEVIQLIHKLSELGIKYLNLTGGEPLLREDLFEILERAETDTFHGLALSTNGLLVKKRHDEINKSPINGLSVSIDGLEQTNDAIRGIEGAFRLAFEGLSLIEKKSISIITTLNRKSAHELESLIDMASSFGYDWGFNLINNQVFFVKGCDMDSLWPESQDIERIVKTLRKKLKLPSYKLDYIERYYKGEAQKEPPCYLGFLALCILSNGDVLSGCYPLPAMGNIFKRDLHDIIKSEQYRKRAIAMLRRECPGCFCGVFTNLWFDNLFCSILSLKSP